MGYKLEGNWKSGIAYDLHTISSEYLGQDEYGHDRYDNTRSEMGELVYQLKYKNDQTVVGKITDLLLKIKGLDKIDAIIPIPPSKKNRTHQPVESIAVDLGEKLGVTVHCDCLEKIGNSKELKSMTDQKEREDELEKSMRISTKHNLTQKNILLIDDLFRSGATLRVATNLLYSEMNVKNVYVLTMTKTRKNR